MLRKHIILIPESYKSSLVFDRSKKNFLRYPRLSDNLNKRSFPRSIRPTLDQVNALRYRLTRKIRTCNIRLICNPLDRKYMAYKLEQPRSEVISNIP